jgi:hypothetical protein
LSAAVAFIKLHHHKCVALLARQPVTPEPFFSGPFIRALLRPVDRAEMEALEGRSAAEVLADPSGADDALRRGRLRRPAGERHPLGGGDIGHRT